MTRKIERKMTTEELKLFSVINRRRIALLTKKFLPRGGRLLLLTREEESRLERLEAEVDEFLKNDIKPERMAQLRRRYAEVIGTTK